MNWFKRHKGWTIMFALTIIAFIAAMALDATGLGYGVGYLWFFYLIAWSIWGRKRSW